MSPNLVTVYIAGSCFGWYVTTQLTSSIYGSLGNYSDEDNGILKKKGYLHIYQCLWYPFWNFLALHYNITASKSISHHAGWRLVDTTYFNIWRGLANRILQCVCPAFLTFSPCVCMTAVNMTFGGSGDMSLCQHFQLSTSLFTSILTVPSFTGKLKWLPTFSKSVVNTIGITKK